MSLASVWADKVNTVMAAVADVDALMPPSFDSEFCHSVVMRDGGCEITSASGRIVITAAEVLKLGHWLVDTFG